MIDRDRDQAELDEILLPEPEDEPPPRRRLRKGRANTAFVLVPMLWVERLAKPRGVAVVARWPYGSCIWSGKAAANPSCSVTWPCASSGLVGA